MIKGRRVDSCNVDDNFVYLTCGIHPHSWRSSTRPSPSLLSFRILSFVVGPWNWDTDFIVHFVGLFNNQTLYLSDKVGKSPCHTSYLSRATRVYLCKFFLAGENFYRFNAKNWHFRQILCKKVAFFTDLTQKNGVFQCKFYSSKNLSV